MTDTKHTPDRIWAQDADPSECHFIGGGWWDDSIGATQSPDIVEYLLSTPTREAAGELLEALENLLKVHEGEGGTKYHAGDIARAAIAKAKGEETQ